MRGAGERAAGSGGTQGGGTAVAAAVGGATASPALPAEGVEQVVQPVLNLPLQPLWVRHSRGKDGNTPVGRQAFRAAVVEKLLPRLKSFGPDLLLISAGFDGASGDDGNAQDDVGGLDLTDDDFRCVHRAADPSPDP